MSNQYDNTNSGALFRNDRKERDNQPDHKGSAEVKCPCCGETSEFWLAAWIKQKRDGTSRFFSLAFTPKEARPEPAAPAPGPGGPKDDPEDDIPF